MRANISICRQKNQFVLSSIINIFVLSSCASTYKNKERRKIIIMKNFSNKLILGLAAASMVGMTGCTPTSLKGKTYVFEKAEFNLSEEYKKYQAEVEGGLKQGKIVFEKDKVKMNDMEEPYTYKKGKGTIGEGEEKVEFTVKGKELTYTVSLDEIGSYSAHFKLSK